jgi:hypothetical protein
MLSTHDVAKLTRRPAWLMRGLSLIGRFPPQIRYRGRRLGWRKAEVLAWLTREITLDESGATPRCPRRHPQQQCLPLEPCCPPIAAKPSVHRRSSAKGRLS